MIDDIHHGKVFFVVLSSCVIELKMDIGTIASEHRDGISTQGFDGLFTRFKYHFSGGVFGGEMHAKIADTEARGAVRIYRIHQALRAVES